MFPTAYHKAAKPHNQTNNIDEKVTTTEPRLTANALTALPNTAPTIQTPSRVLCIISTFLVAWVAIHVLTKAVHLTSKMGYCLIYFTNFWLIYLLTLELG